MPFFRTQIILFPAKRRLKLITLQVGSYYDWATLHEVFVLEEYSFAKFQQGRELEERISRRLESSEKTVILDLGANVGLAAAYFGAKYPGATIICVEPVLENCERIRRNVHHFPNVEIVEAAVGSGSDLLTVLDAGAGNNAYRTFGDGVPVATVRQVTVGDLISGLGTREIALVKIDIEGFESQLFASNYDWIDLADAIVIETHDWMLPGQTVSQNFINALSGRSRDLVFDGGSLMSSKISQP